jgi:two-component sensor histidine kinase
MPPADALSLLLAATADVRDGGFAPLRPLWVEEAMHRAHTTLRLVRTLRRHQPIAGAVAHRIERCLAAEIADAFRSLETPPARALVPCAAVLRDLTRSLVALFGPAVGIVDMRAQVERVSLPAYARRALVLLTAELVCNAMLHAFTGRCHGLIEVECTAPVPGRVRLAVSDDGHGFPDIPCIARCSVSAGLADLLNADLQYARTGDGITVAAIEFRRP